MAGGRRFGASISRGPGEEAAAGRDAAPARSRRKGNCIRGSETGRGGAGSRGARPHGKFFFSS